MKFIIDIPESEFKGEIADHFQDFFMRLQAEIQHRLSSNDTLVCGNYELETIEMLLKSFKNATLEQAPRSGELIEQEPSEDVISREPFTDSTICEGFSCDECSFSRKDKGGCILEERVMNLPSAKPQEPERSKND